jgi:hypothetical protein
MEVMKRKEVSLGLSYPLVAGSESSLSTHQHQSGTKFSNVYLEINSNKSLFTL